MEKAVKADEEEKSFCCQEGNLKRREEEKSLQKTQGSSNKPSFYSPVRGTVSLAHGCNVIGGDPVQQEGAQSAR